MDMGKVVVGIIAFLITLGLGAIVLFEVLDSPDQLDESVVEYFTTDSDGNALTRWDGATGGSNYTGETFLLADSAYSITNITCYNASGGAGEIEHYLETAGTNYSVNRDLLNIKAGQCGNFTQVNVTYTSNTGNIGGDVRDMGVTVYQLAPLIALVLVATIIIGIVITGMSGSGKRGL